MKYDKSSSVVAIFLYDHVLKTAIQISRDEGIIFSFTQGHQNT